MTISEGMCTPTPSIEIAAALVAADESENLIMGGHEKNTADLNPVTPSSWRARVGKKLNPFSERNLISTNDENDYIEHKPANKKEKDVLFARKYEVFCDF